MDRFTALVKNFIFFHNLKHDITDRGDTPFHTRTLPTNFELTIFDLLPKRDFDTVFKFDVVIWKFDGRHNLTLHREASTRSINNLVWIRGNYMHMFNSPTTTLSTMPGKILPEYKMHKNTKCTAENVNISTVSRATERLMILRQL